MNGQMDIVSNCPLCEVRALHILGAGAWLVQQCISFGYASSERFLIRNNENIVLYYDFYYWIIIFFSNE